MFQKIKEFLFGKLPAEQTPPAPVEAVPYKVEPPKVEQPTPAPVLDQAAQCGCGRSPTGLCVGLHKLTAEEWAAHADNPAKVLPTVKVETTETSTKAKTPPKPKAPAKPKATAIKAPAKPKAAVKSPAKKPAARKRSTPAQS